MLLKQTILLLLALPGSPENQDSKKAKRDGKAKSEPWWKCRIKDYIKELNRNINLLTRHENGEVKSKWKVENLESCKKAWRQYQRS